MGTGGIDGSAAVKAFMVTLISLMFLAEYCALIRVCNDTNVGMADCRVPAYYANLTYSDEKSTWALWFAIIYAIMACISFAGCSMIVCRSDGFAKFYAIVLVVCMGGLTIGEYWVIGGIVSAASNNNDTSADARNYEGFKVAVTWFLQLNLYLLAAYDAWDTDDERKVDIGDIAKR